MQLRLCPAGCRQPSLGAPILGLAGRPRDGIIGFGVYVGLNPVSSSVTPFFMAAFGRLRTVPDGYGRLRTGRTGYIELGATGPCSLLASSPIESLDVALGCFVRQ